MCTLEDPTKNLSDIKKLEGEGLTSLTIDIFNAHM